MKKRFTAMLLAAITCFTLCSVGCKKRVANDDQTLEIYVLQAGYGSDWLDAIIGEFKKQEWAKEKYPKMNVVVSTRNREWSFAPGRIKAGGVINTCDLFFGIDLQKVFIERDKEGNPYLADLSDVYASTVPGEDVVFADKVIDSFNASSLFYDKALHKNVRYAVTWAAGMDGILYNEALFAQNNWEVPLTTDELKKLCDDIAKSNLTSPITSNKVFPFVQSSNTEYWRFMFPLWWAQYEGYENYCNYYKGEVDGYLDSAVVKQKGRLRSLEAIETFLSGDNKYLHENAGALQYRDAQVRFLMGEGVMHVNGDWFNLEMAEDLKVYKSAKIKMMRTPVLSSIIEKLPTVNDDETLHKVIEAVDNGETSYEGVSAADFKAVKEARTIIESIGPNHNAVIPEYASAKELAKDFLRFMATDIANEAYAKATDGAAMPFKYSLAEKSPETFGKASDLQKSRIAYYNDAHVKAQVLPSPYAFSLYTYGKLLPRTTYSGSLEFAFYNKTHTAQGIYDGDIKYWTDNSNRNWNTAVALANLT